MSDSSRVLCDSSILNDFEYQLECCPEEFEQNFCGDRSRKSQFLRILRIVGQRAQEQTTTFQRAMRIVSNVMALHSAVCQNYKSGCCDSLISACIDGICRACLPNISDEKLELLLMDVVSYRQNADLMTSEQQAVVWKVCVHAFNKSTRLHKHAVKCVDALISSIVENDANDLAFESVSDEFQRVVADLWAPFVEGFSSSGTSLQRLADILLVTDFAPQALIKNRDACEVFVERFVECFGKWSGSVHSWMQRHMLEDFVKKLNLNDKFLFEFISDEQLLDMQAKTQLHIDQENACSDSDCE